MDKVLIGMFLTALILISGLLVTSKYYVSVNEYNNLKIKSFTEDNRLFYCELTPSGQIEKCYYDDGTPVTWLPSVNNRTSSKDI